MKDQAQLLGNVTPNEHVGRHRMENAFGKRLIKKPRIHRAGEQGKIKNPSTQTGLSLFLL